MFNVLNVCCASKQKSLKGLDNIAAAGAYGFGDLKTLSQEGIERIDAKTWSDCCRHVRDKEAEYWKSDIAVGHSNTDRLRRKFQ